MKLISYKLVVFLLFSILFSSCVKEDGIYFNEITDVKQEYSKLELDILNLVNMHRETKGIQALEKMNIVSSVALTHTNYMVETGKVDHFNFPERHENLVLKAEAQMVGENVAYGFNSSKGVVEAWLQSKEHKEIIENDAYTHFGISIGKDLENRNYFTQIFIKR